MRKIALVSAGIIIGYMVRSRRNAAFASAAHRVVDAVFGGPGDFPSYREWKTEQTNS